MTGSPDSDTTGGVEVRRAPRRGRRADGERSRRAILEAAAELSSVEGLEGLSIGRLAEHVGMSKSGLYAHFRSKEELQLATIETAQEIFEREVLGPSLDGPPGLGRALGLCDAFLAYLDRRVFPGGCFFAAAAAEIGPHEGRVKARIQELAREWSELLVGLIGDARKRGELPPDADARQLAFELDALLLGANAAVVLFGDPEATGRARRGVRARLGLADEAEGREAERMSRGGSGSGRGHSGSGRGHSG